MAFKEWKVREEEILEAAVFLSIGGQREDDTYGYLLLPNHTQTWTAAFIRHVEALLHRPKEDRIRMESTLQ